MNKKIILSLVAIAVIIPVLGIGMIPDNVDADKLGKEYAATHQGTTMGTHSSEAYISEQEEINRAELIIDGVVIEVKPFWKIINENPRIYTEYTVKVNDVIKGNTQDDNIKVILAGGQLDGITSKTEAISMQYNDNVILLLGKDLNSIFGSDYHPISVSKSTYIVEDEIAKNMMTERNMDKTLLKEKLERLAGQ